MLRDEPAPEHNLNTWSAQMATRMLGSVPRRMSFKRKLSEKLPGSLDLQQPLLQQHSRIAEVGLCDLFSNGFKLLIHLTM